MELTFKTKNNKQLLAAEYWIDNETEEILYGGAKGGGKSFLGASLIFGDALIYPETHYFIARQELTDLRKFTIPTIHEVFQKWGLNISEYATFNGQDNVFTLYNGSKVFLLACKEIPSDPMFERFGSMQMTRGWIEEGGEIAEQAKANLWLSVGRWKNKEYNLKKKLLITANPKKGWMKRDFVGPFVQGYIPITRKYVQALASDNVAYLGSEYVESLKQIKDTVTRQRLSEGNWDYDEDKDSLISFDALTDTFSNTITKDGNKYLVADIARLGQDTTVFTFWEGLEMYRIEQYHKQDTNTTAQKIKDFANSERIPYSHILIDADGIGGGVIDQLFGVKSFMANSTPLPTASQIREKQGRITTDLTPKTNFKNLKAQCAFKLAELINEHKIAFKTADYRETIIEELTALLRQKDIDSDGKLAIIPKEGVKQTLGKSPDVGDCMIYRAWFELQKEAEGQQGNFGEIVAKQKAMFNLRKSQDKSNK
jgi:hypothetical protein